MTSVLLSYEQEALLMRKQSVTTKRRSR